jgi:hypothetical protein
VSNDQRETKKANVAEEVVAAYRKDGLLTVHGARQEVVAARVHEFRLHTRVAFVDRFGGKEKGSHGCRDGRDVGDLLAKTSIQWLARKMEVPKRAMRCGVWTTNGWDCTGRRVVRSYVDFGTERADPKDSRGMRVGARA